MLAEGTGAQYPMLTNAIATIQQDNPDAVDDIGAFALPAQDAADTRLTIWEPNGLYIPKTSTGDKLAAAKKFIAFANSSEGCGVQNDTGTPGGPYVISTCTLPDSVPPMIGDLQKYLDDGKASPALEFLSPIKARTSRRSACRSAPASPPPPWVRSSTTRTSCSRPSSSASRLVRSVTATLTTAVAPPQTTKAGPGPARKRMRSFYPAWFFIPAIALYVVFFAVPTFAGFYFSLTRWTLFDQTFIGFDNFVRFFQDPQLVSGFVHTFEYGFVTSAAKVVLGLALALLLTSPVLGRATCGRWCSSRCSCRPSASASRSRR